MARTFETERIARVLTVRFDNPSHNFTDDEGLEVWLEGTAADLVDPE